MANKKIKNILRSRTFWVAVTQGLIGVFVIFVTEFPEVGGLVVAKAVLDGFLRLVTGESVEFRLK